MAELIQCKDCPKLFWKHRHNHERCAMCSHAYQIQKSTERKQAKRLAAKEQQS